MQRVMGMQPVEFGDDIKQKSKAVCDLLVQNLLITASAEQVSIRLGHVSENNSLFLLNEASPRYPKWYNDMTGNPAAREQTMSIP